MPKIVFIVQLSYGNTNTDNNNPLISCFWVIYQQIVYIMLIDILSLLGLATKFCFQGI